MNLTTKSNITPSENLKSHRPPLFWKFGAEFHGGEAVRTDATEFFVFTLIGILCLWPIVSAMLAIVRVFGG